jgi:hypothetical protein
VRRQPPRVGPFHNIDNLKKDHALARLLELEEDQERTFFEMGGILSMIQERKWFDPCASLDEWVEKNTAMRRAKARALIQIYDAIVKSGLKWADIQHIEWTKLRAIASVLNEKNADHWIEVASSDGKGRSRKAGAGALFRVGQTKTWRPHPHADEDRQAAGRSKPTYSGRDRAGQKLTSAVDDSAALEVICQDYTEGRVTITEKALVNTLVRHLNTLDKDAAAEIMKVLREQVRHAL